MLRDFFGTFGAASGRWRRFVSFSIEEPLVIRVSNVQ
jgi:hypothetical protein